MPDTTPARRDHDDDPEQTWEPTTSQPMSRCRTHGIEFTRDEAFNIGSNMIAWGCCPECHRAPPRGDMPAPDYWQPSGVATSAIGALTCAYHERSFPADACCVACMEEDEPELLEELRRKSRPEYVRADGSRVVEVQ